MLEILERIVAGNGELSDLDELEELADMIENTALCGLGKSAPKPVISTIHAFRKEYEEHLWIRNAGLMSVPGSGYLRSILISVRAAQSVQEIVR